MHRLYNNLRLLNRFCKSNVSGAGATAFRAGSTCSPNNKGSTGSMKETLLKSVSQREETGGSHKVTVVGVGQVGMACAVSILAQRISSDVALVDCVAEKLKGEMLDLQHGSIFVKSAKIQASTDYAVTACSRVCVITAGARQKVGETRLDLVKRNTDIVNAIVPQLLKYSPDTIIIVASNPVDLLTYVIWKASGLPRHKVIGAGTNLDSARFRYFISERLGVAPWSCHGWIIGEHGDTSVPVWSGVSVAGVRLQELNPAMGTKDDKEKWKDIHTRVIKSAYEVIQLKGYTSWAIALSVSQIVQCILKNDSTVLGVCVPVKGLHGIKDDVFLSLPAVLGENGVTDIVIQPLSSSEQQQLQKSAKVIADIQAGLK